MVQQELNEKMPRILADFKLMTSNGTQSMRELLVSLADFVDRACIQSTQIMSRFKMDLVASSMSSPESQNYDPVLKDMLVKIAEGGEKNMLDMAAESSAGLAASLASRLPALPASFANAIGKETCVWFNAFSGRIYRDTARSSYFHQWFCAKVSHMLNKGHRPGFVDEFVVSNLQFGQLPPLLCNMQWAPLKPSDSADAEYDVVCTADMAFRSGLKFSVSTR